MMSWTVSIYNRDADFVETEHPRGQPENKGQFSEKPTTGTAALRPVSGKRTQWPEHITKLKLPPAWTNVRVSDDPDAKLQAIGTDGKGRDQYVYHARFAASQAAVKFSRIKELEAKFADVKQQNENNRVHSNDARTREHAQVMALIMELGIRPGSEEDTQAEHESYGATTLLGKHVVRVGSEVRLRFTPGKKHGEAIDLPVSSKRLANMLLGRADEAGDNGKLFPNVSDASLRKYTHSFDGGGFKPKDWRTLLGTRTAQKEVSKLPRPQTAAQYKKAVRQVAQVVAAKLGNTPVVALQSYINPMVFAPWQMVLGM